MLVLADLSLASSSITIAASATNHNTEISSEENNQHSLFRGIFVRLFETMEESQLALPLLNDFDRDEEIISQLLSTNNHDTDAGKRSNTCSNFRLSRERCGVITFALLIWFGFMSSLWLASSCKLIEVDYNKGGVQLSVEALGFFRYEQKITNGTHTSNYCVPYGQPVHTEVNLDGFFPEDKTLQTYSIISPSAVFASIVALMICVVDIHTDPEILTGSNPEYVDPGTTIKSSAFAGVLLMIAGTFQLVATLSLLYYHPRSTSSGYESPLCNPAYSHCRLGPIGIWAVIGSLVLFLAGIVTCFSSRLLAQRFGRSKKFCC